MFNKANARVDLGSLVLETDCGVVNFVTDLGVLRGLEPGGRESGVKHGSGSSLRERVNLQFKPHI